MPALPAAGRLKTFSVLLLSSLFTFPSWAAGPDLSRPLEAPKPFNVADLGLEALKRTDVVYSASKSEQKTTEAPGTTTILTATEIKVGGFRTLDDLLNYVRGFYVSYDRNYSYVGLRGFGSLGGYNSRVLLLVDGHRINDNVYGQFYTGQDAVVDMEVVDHVEIIRGPASVVYGSSAVFGVINVVTKRGKDIQGALLTSQGGSFETLGGGLLAGGADPLGASFTLQASAYESAGNERLYYPEYDDPATNDGVAEKCDAEGSRHAWFALSLEEWTLRGALMHRLKTVPTGVYGTQFNDPGTYTEDLTAFTQLEYQQGDPEAGQWTGRLFLDFSHYTGRYLPDGGGPHNIDVGNGAWWGTELRYSRMLLPGNKLTLGGEFVDNFQLVQKNYDEGAPSPYLDDDRANHEWALYLQNETRLLPELHLTLGGRYNHFSQTGGQWVPRGALIWTPSPTTVLKLVAGKGFRAPSPFELYYEDNGASQLPNPNLGIEQFQTYEIDWEQTFSQKHRVILSVFRYLGEGLILPTLDTMSSLLIYQNIGRSSGNGLELEYQFHNEKGVQGRLSWAHQRAQDDLTGQVLPESPQDLIKASLQVPLDPKLMTVSGEYQFRGGSFGTNGVWAGEYGVFNLKLFFPRLLWDGLEGNLSAYNLFDAAHSHPASNSHTQSVIPQDGLALWAHLSLRP